jgi:hypothetical protein
MICKGPSFLAVVWFGSLPPVSKLGDQAFSPSYDLAPTPQSVSSTSDEKKAEKERNLLTGEGGTERNHTTARKPGPL